MNHSTSNRTTRGNMARLFLVSIALSLLIGCAGTSGGRKQAVVSHNEGGFEISEQIRPRLGLRSEFNRAREAVLEGDVEEGIELLLKITESDPDFTAPHINLGIAYREIGKFGKAEASLLRALETNPRHPVAHNEIGIVYRRMGKFEDARASYERALERHDNFHFARKNLAIVCDLFLEDLACALKHYETYRNAVPDDEKVAMWIADLTQRQESKEQQP